MKAWLARYNKLWAAMIGVSTLFVMDRLGLTIPGLSEVVSDAVISALTLITVERIPNAKPEEDHDPEDLRGI